MAEHPSMRAQCVFERYAVYDEIASGGMATVHIGRLRGAVGFSRTVAIKRLHSHMASQPEFVAMLLDEARLVSRIRHPNVVQTLDVVTERGEVALVLEYVHGDSLHGLMKRARTSRELIAQPIVSNIVGAILQGLSAAHDALDEQGRRLGLVHRDVSPQNVVVSSAGVAALLDFGVAKAAGRLQTTREGALKGKVGYTAPELLDHAEVSPRADVYAAGVVLWECLTNRRLFAGANPATTIAQVLIGLVDPPSKYAPELSEALDAVVLKAVERDPNKRFATACEMAIALEEAVPAARNLEVADWVRRVAKDELDRRGALIANIERMSEWPTSMSDLARGAGATATGAEVATSDDRARRRAPSSRWVSRPAWLGVAAIVCGMFALGRRAATHPPTASVAASDSSTVPTADPPPPPATSEPRPGLAPSISVVPNEAISPAQSAHVRTTRGRSTAHASSAAAPAPPPNAECAEPYVIDAHGMKSYKRECFK